MGPVNPINKKTSTYILSGGAYTYYPGFPINFEHVYTQEGIYYPYIEYYDGCSGFFISNSTPIVVVDCSLGIIVFVVKSKSTKNVVECQTSKRYFDISSIMANY